jgi:glycosyltransferase involved in cell wall biosynthesis
MHGGLIPIVSRQSGVDIDGFGIILSECSIEEVQAAARQVAARPAEEVRSMTRNAWKYARANHTRENFSKEYRNAVDSILGASKDHRQKPQL